MAMDSFPFDSKLHPQGGESLLFLSHLLPWPVDTGAKTRTYHLLALLSSRFKITLLCYRGQESCPARIEESRQALLKLADRVEILKLPNPDRPARFFWNHLRSLLSRKVYTRFLYDTAEFTRRLEEVLQHTSPALVHADSLDLSRYFPLVQHLPLVCGHHNIESELLARRADATPSPLTRRYLRLQSRLLRVEERRWATKADLNLVCSVRDKNILSKLAPKSRAQVIPNGVDTERFAPGDAEESGIIFVGGADWFPNRNGMDQFARRILPKIREKHPEVGVTWVGPATEDLKDRYQREHGIRMRGRVDDVRPYLAESACMVVPLWVGGGTRLKIVEGWAMAKAVVSTGLGCEGLRARDGNNILIRDRDQAFAEAVSEILRDRDLRDRLGSEGRRTAVRFYDWKTLGSDLTAGYLRLISDSHHKE